MEIFYTFFSKFENLTFDELVEAASIFESINYQKNDVILQEGEVDRYIYFLNTGIIRLYKTVQEKDVSILFYERPGILSSFISFAQQTKSPIGIQAITDVQIFRAKKVDMERLYNKNQTYERLARKITEFLLIEMMEKYMDLLTLKTPDRYKKLLEEWGESTYSQISIKHISSFLRIEPESLSRIRKQLKSE